MGFIMPIEGIVQFIECPYGANTKIIVRGDCGKCILASEVKRKLKFYQELESELEKSDCPQPDSSGFFRKRACRYSTGEYQEM